MVVQGDDKCMVMQYLCGGARGLQNPVQGVEDVQHQHPGRAQQMVQPVGDVEEGTQGMYILGGQHHPL